MATRTENIGPCDCCGLVCNCCLDFDPPAPGVYAEWDVTLYGTGPSGICAGLAGTHRMVYVGDCHWVNDDSSLLIAPGFDPLITGAGGAEFHLAYWDGSTYNPVAAIDGAPVDATAPLQFCRADGDDDPKYFYISYGFDTLCTATQVYCEPVPGTWRTCEAI